MREVFVTLMLLCAAGCSAEPIQRSAEPVHERDRQVEETPLMTWADLLARPKATPTYEFDVGPASANVAELWLPEGDGPHPVVIMIHGGCWQKQIADRTLMHYAAEAMRREGFAVWNIEYRGVDEEGGGYPGTFRDVAIAADAVETVARDHNLDLSNLVAYGHSAGGHLAAWLAARPNLPAASPLASSSSIAVGGVVNSGGLADLETSAPVTLPSCLSDILDVLTGPPSESRPNVFSDTSPARLLPLGVTLININGARDRIAPPTLGDAFAANAIEAGDNAALVIVSGGHVELIAPGTPAFDETVAQIRALTEPDQQH